MGSNGLMSILKWLVHIRFIRSKQTERMSTPLSQTEITEVLETLPGWHEDGNRLIKTFVFASFPEAISFIVRIGFIAEKLNHHPELTNVYNRVGIALTTHDAGNLVTEKDAMLARAIQGFSWVA